MEDYPPQKGALVTVVAVEGAHVVVADADGVRYRARATARPGSSAAEPLKPGDVLIVNRVKPADGLTVVERLTTYAIAQRLWERYCARLLDELTAQGLEIGPCSAFVAELLHRENV